MPKTNKPLILHELYDSPYGEIQLLKRDNEQKLKLFLRKKGGLLCGLSDFRGPNRCLEIHMLSKKEKAALNCIFLFEDGDPLCRNRVSIKEMLQKSIFGIASLKVRKFQNAL